MVDQTMVTVAVLAGAILGAFGRAMLPYLRKLKEQEEQENTTQQPVKFKQRYLMTTVFSLIVAIGIAMTAFPGLTANLPADAPITSIFILSFIGTWGTSDLVNQVVATSGNLKPSDTKQEVKPNTGTTELVKKAVIPTGDQEGIKQE